MGHRPRSYLVSQVKMGSQNRRVKVYISGRGFVDIAKTVIEKFAKAAAVKAAEVAGDKVGNFAAAKLADKILPAQRPNEKSIKAIEDLERKIKDDIDKVTGRGFKLIR